MGKTLQDKFDEVSKKFPSDGELTRIPTPSNDLNNLLSKPDEEPKGLPTGKVCTVYGDEGVGKSTISLELCRSFCEEDLGAVYIDSEEGLTHDFIVDMGLEDYYKELFTYHKHVGDYSQLEDVLQAYLEIGDEIGLIVIDSLKSISVPVEDDEKVSDGRLGHEAQYDSDILGSYKSKFARQDVTILLVEQVRYNIDTRYGNTRAEVSAGKGVKFYTDILLRLKQKQKHRDDDNNIISADIEFTAIKNKTASVGSCVVPIKYSEGFSATLLIMDRLDKSKDEIDWYEQNGAWYTIYSPDSGEEMIKAHGADELEEWVDSNQDKIVEWLAEDGFVE